jgi:hypothetical protein
MKKTALLFLVVAAFFQCSRSLDKLGPDACPSDNFSINSPLLVVDHVTTSTTDLNLDNSFADISFSFNEPITYTLKIVGQSSGAEFKLCGKGNSLKNYEWYGNATNSKHFSKGEILSYGLYNVCKNEAISSGQIKLTTNISYANYGLHVVSFDPGTTIPANPYPNSNIAGLTLDYAILNPSSPNYNPALQGSCYAHFKANSPKATWYFGGQTYAGVNYSALNTDPSRVYLNFFAKGASNSQCYILLKENLQGANLDRKYLANVTNEWKLYSVRLSEIGVKDPSAIISLAMALQAATHEDTAVELDLDLITFSLDKPF